MTKPIKPTEPKKPYEPNKHQKTICHSLNLNDLMQKTIYLKSIDYQEEENYTKDQIDEESGDLIVSKEECLKHNRNPWLPHHNDQYYAHTRNVKATLADVLKLVPANIEPHEVFIELDTQPSDGFDVYEGIRMWLESPFDYEAALNQYNLDMIQYKKDKQEYDVKLKDYKEYLLNSKEQRNSEKLAQKKSSLEKELAKINNSLKATK